MKQRYLEVTFRNGKPLAAYLYLPRAAGAKAVRTSDAGRGVKVDFDAGETPIGVEITAPSAITIDELLALLASLGIDQLDRSELAPLAA
ncbi:MAG TPA: hypothetical protein VL326_07810 [Kofleriaceae bacterium]|jgi:hypothetical protein|nr:hypothetical protein [Kofleriaceae bacterium]